MDNPSLNIRLKRNDLSPYLFHYTKGDEALEILKLIICEMKLKSKLDRVCFTEAPLTSSISLFKYFQRFQPTFYKPSLKPKFQPYGIGISRDFLFQKGARPVIYGTDEELKLIPYELQWRCLLLNPNCFDFSWLREWRIHSEEFDFSTCKDEIIVITQTKDELTYLIGDENFDVDFSYEYETANAFPYIITTKTRTFKGIALDEIKENEFNSDNDITCHISKQNTGEELD